MTTLLAIQSDNWCLMASDSQTTSGHIAGDCSGVGKICVNGDFLIGTAGTLRGSNIIQHTFIAPKIGKIKNVDKFMVNKFIPTLRNTFVTAGYDMKDSSEIASHDNEFLVAVGGVIYMIDEVYGIERQTDRIYTSGSGSHLALGAAYALGAHTLDSYDEAVEVADKAIKTAIKYDIFSSGKVQVALQKKNGDTWITHLDD